MDAPPKKLSAKQAAFVAAYAGNGTEAARLAGYKGSDATLAQVASENLRKPDVAAAIEARTAKQVAPLIATREARQKFWTEVMEGHEQDMAHRLKASELLGKSEADFTEKQEHSVPQGVSITITRTVRKS